MPQFIAKKTINAPLNKVWPLLDNFENIHVFHPGVNQSSSLNGQAKGLGAKRQCDFYDGGFAQEEVVIYKPEQEFMTVSVYGGTPMKAMKKFNVDFSARDMGSNQTEVTVVGRFTPKFGPIGWLMGNLLIKNMIKKTILKVISGMETHIKTGKVVGQS